MEDPRGQQQQPQERPQPAGRSDHHQSAIDRGANSLTLFGKLLGLDQDMCDQVVQQYRDEFDTADERAAQE